MVSPVDMLSLCSRIDNITDTVIWLGDFNYRVGLSYERAMDLVRRRDIEKLYENDQVGSALWLHFRMVAGSC